MIDCDLTLDWLHVVEILVLWILLSESEITLSLSLSFASDIVSHLNVSKYC